MRGTDWTEAIKFFTPLSRSKRVHPNFVFRFSYCCLSDEVAASSVGVDIAQLHRWDDGVEDIPFSVRRVWLYESGRELPKSTCFSGWSFKGGRLVNPDGIAYTEREINVALFLLAQQSGNRNM